MIYNEVSFYKVCLYKEGVNSLTFQEGSNFFQTCYLVNHTYYIYLLFKLIKPF